MLKVYHLMMKQNTFEITMKYKGVGVRVEFVDGNTYNGTPAKCYTRDAFKQRAIEASQMFKNRDIVLARTVVEDSDRKAEAKKAELMLQRRKARAAVADTQPMRTEPVKEPSTKEPATDSQGTGKGTDKTPKTKKEPKTTKNGKADNVDAEAPADEQPKNENEKAFESLEEAILFVAQTYNEEVSTEEEVREILESHGLTFTIQK